MKYNTLLLRLASVIIVLLCSTSIGRAQDFFEPTSGPEGSEYYSLVSLNDDTLLMLTLSGPYRSTDGGNSWTMLSDTFLSGISNYNGRLAIGSDGTLFAAWVYGPATLYRYSVDSMNWTPIFSRRKFYNIAVGANHTIFAATQDSTGNDTLFRSTDNGNTWQAITTNSGSVKYVVVSDAGDVVSYNNVGGSKFCYRSTNNGNLWKPLGDSLPAYVDVQDIYGNQLAVSATGAVFIAPVNWYVNEYPLLRLGTEPGAVWTQVTSGLPPNTGAYGVVIGRNNAIYCRTGLGVYRSTDDGISWTATSQDLFVHAAKLLESESKRLFAQAGGRLYRLEDDGLTWKRSTISTHNSNILALAIRSDGTIFVGDVPGNVFRSSDNGDTWTLRSPRQTEAIFTIAIADNGTLFAGTAGATGGESGSGIYRSSDEGVTWKSINIGLTSTTIWALSSRNGTILAATDSGVYRSTDNGEHWASVGKTSLPTQSIGSLLLLDNKIALAGTSGNGIWRSTDDGITWHDRNSGVTDATISPIVSSPDGTIYIGPGWVDGANIGYRSTDRGLSWTKLSPWFAAVPHSATDNMAMACNSRNVLFMSALFTVFDSTENNVLSQHNLVAYSSDHGVTWTQVDDRDILSVGNRYYAFLAFNNAGRLFATPGYQGVWRSVHSTISSVEQPHAAEAAPSLSIITNPVTTTISYSVPSNGVVRLVLYDALGREVRVLASGEEEAGEHSMMLDASGLPSGVYYMRLRADGEMLTRKIVLMR